MSAGLVLCTYRYYAPDLARWLTRDPMGYDGGINVYAYCEDNPIGHIDPSGLSYYIQLKSQVTVAIAAGNTEYALWLIRSAIGLTLRQRAVLYLAVYTSKEGLKLVSDAISDRLAGLPQGAYVRISSSQPLVRCEIFATRAFNVLRSLGMNPTTYRMDASDGEALRLTDGTTFSNGFHYFVRVGNMVYDSLTGPEGQEYTEWLKRFAQNYSTTPTRGCDVH